ncbi:MAG: NusG domain II-containing protein [Clostridia bacterium]|nr:NusG domain II-containing protein [Clostridia bacterium]
MKNKKIRNDVILIGIILVISLAAAAVTAAVHLQKNSGYAAEITVNGKLFGTYPLSGDGEIDVDGLLTVVIRDGQVSVTGSNCRNHLCEKHSPVSLSGSTIVCLPQGVVIRITGDGEVDALI